MGNAANLLSNEITVGTFLDMDLPGVCEWLLVHGTVVSLTHATFPHSRIQSNIHRIFLNLADAGKLLVFTELPYELTPIDSYRADVAVLNKALAEDTAKSGGIIKSAPDLIVEVMSRSNLPYDVDKLEAQCLSRGCLEFWKVVIKHRKRLDHGTPDFSVRVGRVVDGRIQHETYLLNGSIPVNVPGLAGAIPVRHVFEGVGSQA